MDDRYLLQNPEAVNAIPFTVNSSQCAITVKWFAGWIQKSSRSQVCVSAERTHYSCSDCCVQPWWTGISIWWTWWSHEYLVFTGKIVVDVPWYFF